MAKEKMVLRTPLQSVVVQREGKSVVPPIGYAFEFTADEVKQIEAMAPQAISREIVLDAADPAAAAAVTNAGKTDDL